MDEKTIQTYNRMAKEYDDETIDFWERFPRTFFDTFAELIQGKVLDVGSGPGRDGLLLKEKGLEVFCLDASEEMIEAKGEVLNPYWEILPQCRLKIILLTGRGHILLYCIFLNQKHQTLLVK